MPVTLPAADGLAGSITRVAAIMRQRKDPTRATSVTLPRPLFRLLAPTGYCAAACGDPIPNITGNIPSPSPRCPTPGHFGSLCCPARPRYRTRKC
jgi:hypothetical protein